MNGIKSVSLIQIAYALVVFIAGAVIGAIVQEALNKFVLQSASLTLIIVFICLALISIMVYLLVRYTDELRRNIGVKIIYFDRDRHGRATLFAEARKIVEKARQSIFILNSFLVETPEDTEDKASAPGVSNKQRRRVIQERDRYYEAALERAVNGVVYERILQVKEGQTIGDVAKDEGYRKHFHRIFEEKERNPKLQVGLIKAPAKRLSTFVLVDDENLIWQINELLPSGELQMQGVFIIQDPRREITQHFRTFIESAKRDSFGAVERSELPTLK
jgi:hypothetical protein